MLCLPVESRAKPSDFYIMGDISLLIARMPDSSCYLALLNDLCTWNLSLYALLSMSEGSCLSFTKVQNALESFLCSPAHPQCWYLKSQSFLEGFLLCSAPHLAFRWLPVLNFLTSPALLLGFCILLPSTQWRP